MYQPDQQISGRRMVLRAASVLCLLTASLLAPAGALAQGVAIADDWVHVRFFGDQGGVVIDRFGNIVAGASGTQGTLWLYNSQADLTAALYGSTGDLFLGGGSHDGDLFLMGSDGITPNIRAHGDDGWMELGNLGEDGDITLKNNAGVLTVRLDGQSATVEQDLAGNGLVKAWAMINGDGTIIQCWKCNQSTAETKRTSLGTYRISFSPIGTDIQSRPRMAVIDSNSPIVSSPGMISLSHNSLDSATIRVETKDDGGSAADRPFTVFIY